MDLNPVNPFPASRLSDEELSVAWQRLAVGIGGWDCSNCGKFDPRFTRWETPDGPILVPFACCPFVALVIWERFEMTWLSMAEQERPQFPASFRPYILEPAGWEEDRKAARRLELRDRFVWMLENPRCPLCGEDTFLKIELAHESDGSYFLDAETCCRPFQRAIEFASQVFVERMATPEELSE